MDSELLQGIAQIVKAEVQTINDRLGIIETEMSAVKQEVSMVKQEVVKINITIENEIRPNIQLIAEGHMDIANKLDDMSEKIAEIDDIKDSVSVLKALRANDSHK